MKKLAIVASLALAATFGFAGVFASASNVVDTAPTPTQQFGSKVDLVATSVPAQLLTVRCGGSKGAVMFSEHELYVLLDLAQKYPELSPRVCSVFTKRA
jgi:hypothetical protein